MAEAKRDQNRVTTLLGVSSVDGVTPTIVYADPTTNELLVKASVASLPLPSGAATSALQTTGNTLLGGIAGLLPTAFDYISQTQATLTDTWVFKTGGVGGTTVSTITITYVDASKAVISTVAKT